jgi:hypothetical protein
MARGKLLARVARAAAFECAAALAVPPVIVLWANDGPAWLRRVSTQQRAEPLIMIVCLLAVSALVFAWGDSRRDAPPALLFLPLPFLLWAAVRFGPPATSASLPVNIAPWALGGFYFSLTPGVVRVETGATLPIVGGIVVAALTLIGTVIVVVVRNVAPERILRIGIAPLSFGVNITLAGVQCQLVSVMLIGTVVSGMGFGSVFSGTLWTVMPLARPDERASLLSTRVRVLHRYGHVTTSQARINTKRLLTCVRRQYA